MTRQFWRRVQLNHPEIQQDLRLIFDFLNGDRIIASKFMIKIMSFIYN